MLFIGRVLELPSGIDPSFLSAFPDNLRREVVLEQLRIQGIDIRNRQPAVVPAAAEQPVVPEEVLSTSVASAVIPPTVTTGALLPAGATPTATSIQINPEFLAALPPQIQEEVTFAFFFS